MLQATHILATLGQLDTAESKLNTVRALIKEHTPANTSEETVALELFLDFEDANLSWLRDDNREAVLKKLEMALKKYTPTLKESPSRYSYEGLQIRRAFILADLGRWKEALPILEGITSPQEYREGVAFYLGHCYVSGKEYKKAKPYLVEALKLGLPPSLEYRAHNELGIVYFALGGYAQVKIELRKRSKVQNLHT
jgi:tetratricopeptide (TPR) repeat protein